jgi:hypothetical protein
MVLRVVNMLCIVALFSSSNLWALKNTTGSPLGGMGTGYLKFDATTGQIAAVTKVMPAASEGKSEFANHTSSSCGLHFFVNNGGTVASQPKASTLTENAVIPVYAATFPPVGGVTFIDTSYGPIISGAAYDKIAHSPMAFFDVTAINSNATDCEVAVALEFSNISTQGKNLLGGADIGASDGENAISWAGNQTIGSGYMMADCETSTATFSSGAMGTFTTTGTLTAGAGNIVSAKCVIPAGSSTRFRFIISWWSRWILTPPNTLKPGEEDHWYHNYYPTGAKEVATFGMENYELIRGGATGIVKRTMASNFPEWYKERLLNNLYPLIQNSVSAKDGRTGFWEGQYAIIGTIDQNEHAALWYVFNWPQNQWRELQYWARSSFPEESVDDWGQIHHDFNGTTSLSTWAYDQSDINRFMYPWDNWDHPDYSFQSDTRPWMDLNCMFIFKAYELMLATGDRDSVAKYFPYVKNSANRIIRTCTPAYLPTTSLSTYDSDDAQNYTYPSAVSLTAWYAVAEIAKWLGDTDAEAYYRDWYTHARAEFGETYASLNKFANAGDKNHPEGDVAGYSFAHYFGFPANIDSLYITTGCNKLWNKYSIQNGPARLGLWHFYQFDHFGGALTAIGDPDRALEVHYWDYEYYHKASPSYVHWQDLWSSNNDYRSYGTAPTVWRSLLQFSGILVDNANNRIWCRPHIPTSLNNMLINVPIVNPNGWGTLNYNENPVATSAGTRVQSIAIQFDSSVTVKELVLKNNTTVANPGILILHNNAVVEGATSVLEGSGLEKNIRITLAAPIQVDLNGLNIKVYDGAIPAEDLSVHHTSRKIGYALSLTGGQLESGRTISFSVPVSGKVTLDLFQANGAKIGTLANGSLSAGSHNILWKGITAHGGKVTTNMAILRLTCNSGSIAKTVYIKK